MMLVIHTSITPAIRRTHVNSGDDQGNFRNGPELPIQTYSSPGPQLLAALLQPHHWHKEALLLGQSHHIQHKRQVTIIIPVAPLPLKSVVASI